MGGNIEDLPIIMELLAFIYQNKGKTWISSFQNTLERFEKLRARDKK